MLTTLLIGGALMLCYIAARMLQPEIACGAFTVRPCARQTLLQRRALIPPIHGLEAAMAQAVVRVEPLIRDGSIILH